MTTVTQKNSAGGILWLVIVGLLTVVGIGSWIYQAQNGMGVTALSNLETWGLYIAGFIFFMGLSAGSLVLASLPLILNLPKLQPYAKIAAFVSLVSLVVAGLFILIDIGQPMRLWHLVSFGRLGSPLLWDLLLTIVYLVISTVFLVRLIQAERKGTTPPMWLAYIVLVAGLADGMTAFVFATQTAHEFWFSAIQPMTFELGAIASAGGLLLFLLAILNRIGYLKVNFADFKPLMVVIALLLGTILLLLFSEVVTLVFGQSEAGLALVNSMLAAPLFWVEVVALIAALILLLVPQAQTQAGGIAIASILTLVGLVAKRLLFVELGFAIPNISYAGVEIGSSAYSPSLIESLLAFGLVGLFALLLTLGLRSFPLKPAVRN